MSAVYHYRLMRYGNTYIILRVSKLCPGEDQNNVLGIGISAQGEANLLRLTSLILIGNIR